MSLKSWFFGEDDTDEVVEKPYIDPIVEQRRQEKFSKPMLFEDDFEENETKGSIKKKEVKKDPKPIEKKKETYRMSQVISPMFGITSKGEETKTEEKNIPVKRKVYKRKPDGFTQILSPFYGPEEEEEIVAVKEKESAKSKLAKKLRAFNEDDEDTYKNRKNPELDDINGDGKVIDSVENRLRNIASLTDESQDDLKIIEERTGKFKLDFKKDNSLIDEIDDNMSLDELMNLYEKKFKD